MINLCLKTVTIICEMTDATFGGCGCVCRFIWNVSSAGGETWQWWKRTGLLLVSSDGTTVCHAEVIEFVCGTRN